MKLYTLYIYISIYNSLFKQPTLSDMTQYELNFSLLVEQMLSKIIDPTYRQLMVEVSLSTLREIDSYFKVIDLPPGDGQGAHSCTLSVLFIFTVHYLQI